MLKLLRMFQHILATLLLSNSANQQRLDDWIILALENAAFGLKKEREREIRGDKYAFLFPALYFNLGQFLNFQCAVLKSERQTTSVSSHFLIFHWPLFCQWEPGYAISWGDNFLKKEVKWESTVLKKSNPEWRTTCMLASSFEKCFGTCQKQDVLAVAELQRKGRREILKFTEVHMITLLLYCWVPIQHQRIRLSPDINCIC